MRIPDRRQHRFQPKEKKRIRIVQIKKPQTPAPFDFDDLTITGSIFGAYITAIDETCFYLIDRRAAREAGFL